MIIINIVQKFRSLRCTAHKAWDMPAGKLSLHTSAAGHACVRMPFLNATRASVLAVQRSLSGHDHYNIGGRLQELRNIISQSLNLPFEIASGQVRDVRMTSGCFINITMLMGSFKVFGFCVFSLRDDNVGYSLYRAPNPDALRWTSGIPGPCCWEHCTSYYRAETAQRYFVIHT